MNLDIFSGIRAKGWNGIALAHMMGWFGTLGHYYPMTKYVSSSPNTVELQLSIMESCGIQGVILTWQGPTVNTLLHQTAIQLSAQLAARGMFFILLMDPWICKNVPTGQTKESVITTALNDPTVKTILSASSYVPEKYVLDFGTGANLTTLAKDNPTLTFLGMNSGFAWPQIQNPIQGITKQNALSTMKIPAAFWKFFDGGNPNTASQYANAARGDGAGKDNNSQTWDANNANANDSRTIEPQAGSIWQQSMATIPTNSRYAAFATWNDYNERTEIESVMAALTNIVLV